MMDKSRLLGIGVFLVSIVLSGCEDGSPADESKSPNLDEAAILAIVEQRMQSMDMEEFKIMTPHWHDQYDAWSVVVWELPERLHGSVVFYVNDDGEIIRELPGR